MDIKNQFFNQLLSRLMEHGISAQEKALTYVACNYFYKSVIFSISN
jgi:hypothetical protein